VLGCRAPPDALRDDEALDAPQRARRPTPTSRFVEHDPRQLEVAQPRHLEVAQPRHRFEDAGQRLAAEHGDLSGRDRVREVEAEQPGVVVDRLGDQVSVWARTQSSSTWRTARSIVSGYGLAPDRRARAALHNRVVMIIRASAH
jgi:hypothetical protein